MDNYVQRGKRLAYTNSGSSVISADTVVVIGDRIGIAVVDIAVDAEGELQVEGVVTLDKGSDAADMGDQAYWDAANEEITTTASTNVAAGYFAEDADASDTTCKIKLNG